MGLGQCAASGAAIVLMHTLGFGILLLFYLIRVTSTGNVDCDRDAHDEEQDKMKEEL